MQNFLCCLRLPNRYFSKDQQRNSQWTLCYHVRIPKECFLSSLCRPLSTNVRLCNLNVRRWHCGNEECPLCSACFHKDYYPYLYLFRAVQQANTRITSEPFSRERRRVIPCNCKCGGSPITLSYTTKSFLFGNQTLFCISRFLNLFFFYFYGLERYGIRRTIFCVNTGLFLVSVIQGGRNLLRLNM